MEYSTEPLKRKHEIPNYDEMDKFLRENGWDTWYNDDNQIKTEWCEQGKRYEYMGRGTIDAYNTAIQENTSK